MDKFGKETVTVTTRSHQKTKKGSDMQFEGALIKERGITFAVVMVKSHVLGNSTEREFVRRGLSSVFPRVPIVLLAKNSSGIPTYHGRLDIARFLANIHPSRIPWKTYTF